MSQDFHPCQILVSVLVSAEKILDTDISVLQHGCVCGPMDTDSES